MRIANIHLVVVLAVVLGIGVSASAADVEGTYSAKGTNPDGKGEYTGSVIISKTKDTYLVVWSVGTVYIGTGIVVDDILSVAYVDANKKSFGIVAYKILDSGKKLEGVWCPHNGKVLGKETLEKK
jgi:hypothetical protein